VKVDTYFERRVPMRKALRLMAVLTAFGLTAWIGVVALAQGPSAPTRSTSTSTTTSPAPSTRGDDLKGNCDEAEHANDSGCLGVIPVTEDEPANDDQGDDVNDDHGGDVNEDDQGGDINDDQGDDDQGEDEGNDDQGNDEDDNSGPGSVNSGPGSSRSSSGS
jgi:hypothetical protein